ncbi:hypothetical protein QDA05_gp30 [Microbacterium phage Honeyfin]|uniref:Uncharacterized protein n=1 Tax=Microbacterium phage Honeyfin TaxID=2871520 RepID=A0AAE7XDN7_9CAUD|nr:hypothetical protein QDA05_gp30 [Microbacterium phage Honeyfin]QZD98965.1 hypothetical protein SEA_HONEYFIN_30 [Microbacterium phage Honeyfin]WGH20618.1 hypothetical protein SEA_BRAZZALEPHS_28 [Microbacterium phage BrazzalePHS]
MSDPTNTDAATVNTDGQTANTDAQTTSGPAGADAAGDFEYPDGSKPEVGPDGMPILEDRNADFPGEYPEVVADAVLVDRSGRGHVLGAGSGMSAYRGLAAKRAEKAPAPVVPDTDEEREAALGLAAEAGIDPDSLVDDDGQWLDVAAIHERIAAERGQEGDQDAPEGTGGDDDTTEGENGPETGDEGSSDEDDESAGAEDAEEEVDGDADESEAEPETPADEGYDPSAHTVTEVTAYLDENPDQATYVLDRERTGKARVTLIGA